MESQDILNSKAVKAFIKGLLVIIGLFGVLSYGIVAFLLHSDGLPDCWVIALIYVLTVLPLIVFIVFLYLLNLHCKKVFWFSCINYIGLRHKMHKIKKTINDMKLDSEKDRKVLQKIEKMLEPSSKTNSEDKDKGLQESTDCKIVLPNSKLNDDS